MKDLIGTLVCHSTHILCNLFIVYDGISLPYPSIGVVVSHKFGNAECHVVKVLFGDSTYWMVTVGEVGESQSGVNQASQHDLDKTTEK